MNKKFIIEFSTEELKILNDALVRLPYLQVVAIIENINLQIKRQVEKKEEEINNV